ncbi:glucose-6-phosphate 1-dehydrogenase [Lysobacter niabensis]|uniref:Glucose-6-phosphate 1-dehydrogenase n=1 Tax=Agrilutibacter niabensis TaxID=380628 RepID=A0ABU1VRS2_9GAMM|nr:glucose-6-phosphate dehydrogenase [Lysobacter niabensis]MDR7100173.1 glucose-6-phosphate 1-dehydrogenase [Lysobacter niabensis]
MTPVVPVGSVAHPAHSSPLPSFDLVIFGGSGDLALRKLLPALFHRYRDGQIVDGTRIVGVARDDRSDADYREQVRAALAASMQQDDADNSGGAALAGFLQLLSYQHLDLAGDTGWEEFAQAMRRARRVRVFYLAVAPDLFAQAANRLAAWDLVDADTRVVVEKPIGTDSASADAINDALGRVFAERQIFRIDHYLGKETVQNLTALRFGNALFEPLWRAQHIDHVQITVGETIGVEGRAPYYDRAGALRDMVQNHLLQLLCLVAMEPPTSLDADAIRDEKLKVLRALRPIDAGNAAQLVVRGQYRDGAAEGRAVRGYAEELGRSSRTETFVALKAEVRSWRWAGVPFYLRTGKRLPARVSEIVVTFRPVPHSIFEGVSELAPNRLVLRLQPDESVTMWLMNKVPGPGGLRLRHVPMDLSFAETFGGRQADAYERLLMDVVRGNPMLFMRRDEVEAAWKWIDPIRAAWEVGNDAPKPYTAGTWGPSAAVALIERDGRTWHEDAA